MTGQKILIVDGGPEDRAEWGEVLKETGAEIIRANTRDQVLEASAKQGLALAVLDVPMPQMEVRDMAGFLRGREALRSLPLLILSESYSDDFHLFPGYETGPVDFLTKPCHHRVLLSKLKMLLDLERLGKGVSAHFELESSKCYFESILMSMSDPVIIVSPDGTIKDVNRGTLSILGYGCEAGELLGAPARRFFEPSGKTVHPLSDFRLQPQSRMQGFQNIEVVLRTKTSGRIPALLSGSVFRDHQGNSLGTVLLVRDISERKEMEEQLNAYMSRLEKSNRQLQEFAAVASHDLQEPLRKIKAFADLLLSKYGRALNDEAMDFLERMKNAAERMQILMESLLSYSRVTTKAEPFARVDLNQVVRNVLTDLEWRIKNTGAEINLKDLGVIEAEPNQMHQLFQNLLGNALKFHGDQKPVIKVYCSPRLAYPKGKGGIEKAFCRICVEDNGIGFDEKYLDRLFVPFQRLHGRHEYEGTGMGLAICNKIVERHGGSIKARSSPGKGATFTITLPLRQMQELRDQPTTGSQLSLYEEERRQGLGAGSQE